MIKYILKELKIAHYIKNIVIFIPLILNLQSQGLLNWIRGAGLFFIFCLMSSCVYIINDLKDKQNDRTHPIKKYRPIAANHISRTVVFRLLFLLFIMIFLLSLLIPENCWIWILGYGLLNILYICKLREIFYLDICCIAIGFLFRLMAGYSLIGMFPNLMILACVFFTSCYFTCLKRRMEILFLGKYGIHCRKSILKVRHNTIEGLTDINAILAAVSLGVGVGACYSLLTGILLLLMFSLVLLRLMYLSHQNLKSDDPIWFIKKDWILKNLIIFFFLFLILSKLYSF